MWLRDLGDWLEYQRPNGSVGQAPRALFPGVEVPVAPEAAPPVMPEDLGIQAPAVEEPFAQPPPPAAAPNERDNMLNAVSTKVSTETRQKTPGYTPPGKIYDPSKDIAQRQDKIDQSFDERRQAAQEAAALETQAASTEAKAEQEAALATRAELERKEVEQQELQAATDRGYAEAMQLAEEIKNTKQDPSRVFQDMSTGRKIAFYITAALTGLAGDPAGGAKLANQLIDRDLKAQEADLANKKEAYSSKMNLLALNERRLGDRIAAKHATRVQMIEATKQSLRAEAAQLRSPIAQKNLAAQLAALDIEQAKSEQELAFKLGDNSRQAYVAENQVRNMWANTNIQKREFEAQYGKDGTEAKKARAADAEAQKYPIFEKSGEGQSRIKGHLSPTLQPAAAQGVADQIVAARRVVAGVERIKATAKGDWSRLTGTEKAIAEADAAALQIAAQALIKGPASETELGKVIKQVPNSPMAYFQFFSKNKDVLEAFSRRVQADAEEIAYGAGYNGEPLFPGSKNTNNLPGQADPVKAHNSTRTETRAREALDRLTRAKLGLLPSDDIGLK